MIACELKKAFTSIKFKISLLLLTVISVIQSVDAILNSGFEKLYGYPHPAFISLLSNNNNVRYVLIYLWVMPLVLIFMYSNNYNTERQNGLNNVYLSKVKRTNLIFSKILTAFVSTFVVFLVPLILNLFINVLFLHGGNEFFSLETSSVEEIGETLYYSIRHPYTTYLVYMLIASFVVSLLGILCQCICILLKDKKLPYIMAFAIWILYFSDHRFAIGAAFVPFCLEYPINVSLEVILYFLPVVILSVILCFVLSVVKKDEL